MQSSFSDAECVSKKKLARRDRFLAEIEVATPWPALVAALLPYYPKGDGRGRPPIGQERMLRMYIARQCFGLSDEEWRFPSGATAAIFRRPALSSLRLLR
jgi:IS5 family transposase